MSHLGHAMKVLVFTRSIDRFRDNGWVICCHSRFPGSSSTPRAVIRDVGFTSSSLFCRCRDNNDKTAYSPGGHAREQRMSVRPGLILRSGLLKYSKTEEECEHHDQADDISFCLLVTILSGVKSLSRFVLARPTTIISGTRRVPLRLALIALSMPTTYRKWERPSRTSSNGYLVSDSVSRSYESGSPTQYSCASPSTSD